jgi:hypothetical protein
MCAIAAGGGCAVESGMPGKPCCQKRARVVLDVAGLAHDTALHIQLEASATIQKKPLSRKKKLGVPISSTFAEWPHPAVAPLN